MAESKYEDLMRFDDEPEQEAAVDEVATEENPHDVCGDASVLKVRLKDGTGTTKPKQGDKCKVHYHGMLEDGTVFDSSVERGTPFEFTIGTGVIQGWSDAGPTLKKGEKAKFTIKSHKAYGKAGSPPKIPADATLIFEIEMLSWEGGGGPKDVNGDGSVLKRVDAEGSGWETPAFDKSEVEVHVVGKLRQSGDVFFDSRQANDGVPIKWKVGSFPLPCIDDIIVEMKKGESCSVLVRPDQGYGEDGCEAGAGGVDQQHLAPTKAVPGDAVLLYEIELVSWMDTEDLSPAKDGSILKTRLEEGEGWEKAEDLSSVTLSWSISVNGSVVHELAADAARSFVIDEDQLPTGLETAVRDMKKGERARVSLAANAAWGPEGSDEFSVPANAAVVMDVKVLDLTQPAKTWDVRIEERFSRCDELRTKGNAWFKQKNYERASRRYTKSIDYVKDEWEFKTDEDKAKAKQAQLPSLLNRAQCYLSLGQESKALEDCNKALEIEPKSTKALYRKGVAYIGFGEWADAKEALHAVLELDSSSKAARKKLKLVSAKIKQQNERDRKRYKKMFAKKKKKKSKQAKSENGPGPAVAVESADSAEPAAAAV